MHNHADATNLLTQIHEQRKAQPLSILTLAEPILIPQPPPSNSQSTPSRSQQTQEQQTLQQPLNPSTLTADLTHYRDLFSKLRFSYLEQVTKEKYLRGIVGEPSLTSQVSPEENARLEEKLAVMKAELQGKKRGVEELVTSMEGLAGELGGMFDFVEGARGELEVLIVEVQALESEVAETRRSVEGKEGVVVVSEDPRMNLGFEETGELIEEGKRRREDLENEIRALEEELERRSRECEEVERELVELEGRRNEVTRAVIDARRLKEEGGRDRLEEQGRWYVSSEAVMRGLLGVES